MEEIFNVKSPHVIRIGIRKNKTKYHHKGKKTVLTRHDITSFIVLY